MSMDVESIVSGISEFRQFQRPTVWIHIKTVFYYTVSNSVLFTQVKPQARSDTFTGKRRHGRGGHEENPDVLSRTPFRRPNLQTQRRTLSHSTRTWLHDVHQNQSP